MSLYCANSLMEDKRRDRIKANTPRMEGLGPGKERWVPTGLHSETWQQTSLRRGETQTFGVLRKSGPMENQMASQRAHEQACVNMLRIKFLEKELGPQHWPQFCTTVSLLSLNLNPIGTHRKMYSQELICNCIMAKTMRVWIVKKIIFSEINRESWMCFETRKLRFRWKCSTCTRMCIYAYAQMFINDVLPIFIYQYEI